ncbi:hypothetical protein [Streptomyces luteogriseus]|uniref:hypothetical protein n=1 Tax=Streptomyces luteogriseus TaxID=68233 RepID=UPI00261C8AA5|nr:hypothetical protein [uncultured Streptomyces sp.]
MPSVVLITGAATGIGNLTARALAAVGLGFGELLHVRGAASTGPAGAPARSAS